MRQPPLLKPYLQALAETARLGDAREESFYGALSQLLTHAAAAAGRSEVHVTTLPKRTDAGNPDFRLWNGSDRIIGYVEAKRPTEENLDLIEKSEQLERYRATFPNLILTNFLEFRLYRDGVRIDSVLLARPVVLNQLRSVPPAADAPGILAAYFREGKGSDPIVHFYETFLAQYDPAERERRGVYYTPEPVVSYIVRSLHRLLKTEFGKVDGLASDGVTLLDPAAGTMTQQRSGSTSTLANTLRPCPLRFGTTRSAATRSATSGSKTARSASYRWTRSAATAALSLCWAARSRSRRTLIPCAVQSKRTFWDSRGCKTLYAGGPTIIYRLLRQPFIDEAGARNDILALLCLKKRARQTGLPDDSQ